MEAGELPASRRFARDAIYELIMRSRSTDSTSESSEKSNFSQIEKMKQGHTRHVLIGKLK